MRAALVVVLVAFLAAAAAQCACEAPRLCPNPNGQCEQGYTFDQSFGMACCAPNNPPACGCSAPNLCPDSATGECRPDWTLDQSSTMVCCVPPSDPGCSCEAPSVCANPDGQCELDWTVSQSSSGDVCCTAPSDPEPCECEAPLFCADASTGTGCPAGSTPTEVQTPNGEVRVCCRSEEPCPQMPCSLQCPEYVIDSNGCELCRCTGEPGMCEPLADCPLLEPTPNGVMFCPNGLWRDAATGCEICECAPSGCPALNCPEPCPAGYVYDANTGCETCNCRLEEPCPMRDCPEIFCEFGYQEDATGCPTCECRQECSPVLCDLYCQNGFATGEDGCPQCVCNPPAPCIGDTDPNGQTVPACGMFCPNGYRTDPESGCPYCECLPECDDVANNGGVQCSLDCGTYGFATDSTGCNLCRCKTPEEFCESRNLRASCSNVLCESADGTSAPTNFIQDEFGCYLNCDCHYSCPAVNCFDDENRCPTGLKRDQLNCILPTCECRPECDATVTCDAEHCGPRGPLLDESGCPVIGIAGDRCICNEVICPMVYCGGEPNPQVGAPAGIADDMPEFVGCPHGYMTDDSGCSTCECRPEPPSCPACNNIMDDPNCHPRFDADGCQICGECCDVVDTLNCDRVYCPASQRRFFDPADGCGSCSCPPACPYEILCSEECANGYKYDDANCQTCECVEPNDDVCANQDRKSNGICRECAESGNGCGICKLAPNERAFCSDEASCTSRNGRYFANCEDAKSVDGVTIRISISVSNTDDFLVFIREWLNDFVGVFDFDISRFLLLDFQVSGKRQTDNTIQVDVHVDNCEGCSPTAQEIANALTTANDDPANEDLDQVGINSLSVLEDDVHIVHSESAAGSIKPFWIL